MKKLTRTVRTALSDAGMRARACLADCRGDLATNTIGAIIVAVVIVGLLVVAVRAFFPGFFSDMFSTMQSKLSSNW